MNHVPIAYFPLINSEYFVELVLLVLREFIREVDLPGNEKIPKSVPAAPRHSLPLDLLNFVALDGVGYGDYDLVTVEVVELVCEADEGVDEGDVNGHEEVVAVAL